MKSAVMAYATHKRLAEMVAAALPQMPATPQRAALVEALQAWLDDHTTPPFRLALEHLPQPDANAELLAWVIRNLLNESQLAVKPPGYTTSLRHLAPEADAPADPLDAPAATAVLRCVDSMGNTAFVRHTAARGWACTLSNGIPAAMSYAGVPHGEETATVVALERAKTVRDVLRIMKARAQQARSVELEG